MRIAVASDHGGYDLKEKLIPHLRNQGYDVVDLGTDSAASVDYPVFGKKCAEYVVGGEAERGVVMCGTGIGISIAANKTKGARCALVTSDEMARLASAHNKANMLALGGRTTSSTDAARWIGIWLTTPFDGGERHTRRVALLSEM
ncbi:MAG: RpiB/LacA/LacB family sugar-phosphate isomerase [Clostridiales Family XIII bacterium]|jgi:ribose 5-phosphate isomerase B|nr:RpiB/LacA/LacB family sugar-phosphate isomerase [Clostridiales Family XIII bacterium]